MKLLLIFFALGSDFIELPKRANIVFEIKYATKDNFLKENVYGDFKTCKLHPIAKEKMLKAAELLAKSHPDKKFLIFDCLRPLSVQKKMWKLVVKTPKQIYVGDPKYGSIHNFGFAIDLTIVDSTGKPLDMGTEFDDFTPLAQVDLEEKHLKEGKLTENQIQNRRIFRNVMKQAGFIQLPVEWWHYDALEPKKVRSEYQVYP